MNPRGPVRALLLVLVVGVLTACGGPRGPVSGDRAPHPSQVPDLAAVQEPTPRPEPPSRYGNPESYEVFGRRYVTLASAEGYRERGIASWYGTKFHGRRTSSGEPYDMYAMTAAHTTLPLPTYARVTNLENGRSVVVRVNDRGPFAKNRIIDLSYAAAHRIDMISQGTARVEVEALEPYPVSGAQQQAARPPAATSDTDEGGPTPVLLMPSLPSQASVGQVFVQVGAFASRINAERLQDRLRTRGLGPVTVTEGRVEDRRLYRVRLGPKADEARAAEVGRILEGMGITDFRIVSD
ncbi:septal ring lytic transglycosylase RlpA family protein [Ectothiorhodospira sp. 9100]|uniref:septal ring lytic transglycosylase RlpA family protein n=1 Tax=unclassified Ectothiorhodospira TaxID=2684909 RepID=UPI001EE8D1CA|nr:septal ring lytic transglycosylase RlpA family protein [Ectothiorhodospira sp. 9100]MCG5519562.1 septal ring lytic transglycosylase RlpA family protein [Ectothiorhodospira sp. 9905]